MVQRRTPDARLRRPSTSLSFAAFAALALLSPLAARAQTDAPDTTVRASSESATVGRISVVGNTYTDSARVLRTFEVAPGSRFSPEALRRGLRKLVALGLFSDVQLLRSNRPDGAVDITIVVKERPRIGKISFAGQKKREDSDLEKKLFMRSGESFSPTLVQTQVDTLLKYYREEGFPRATIQAAIDTVADRNEVNIRFDVQEGVKVRVTDIVFEGRSAFPAKKLRKAMKTKAKGFFGGGNLEDETFPEDREKLEAYYRNRGHRDMRVLAFELVPGAEERKLTLKIALEEGPRYWIGGVRWTGARAVDSTALVRLWVPKSSELYDLSRIDRARGLAYAEYAEHGYLYVNVDPAEVVRDSLVDVVFTVTEGAPSNIRLVSITGNRGTREKVIRREMDLHEGDRFRRSSLMRTSDDLRRLGIFEEVIPDFSPAESSDVDLVFKVKEKQVGTASAGAGYTNESGLTGFLELGHNNVLGNGQSLALHLERGGRRSDYSLSFTEPWFHDTPTLLGFSAYNTTRQRDFYDERRVGASGRIGRPLPWPDYSRGSISYSLETVEIDTLSSSAVNSITLNGIPVGEPVLTSSFQTNFSRNSSDNAYYPTRGTRLTINDEFAGGPFGGSINFHKHRIEGRAYLPSLRKGVTTMLRLRIGLLGEYGDQKTSVPNYERFRLGGGNTPDPLRGYEDYQIVPPKFVQQVAVYTDTTAGGPDSSLFETVRYPGGRYLGLFTMEQQFPVVLPLRGVLFFDAGNVWDLGREVQPFRLKLGAGLGFRMEIPLLGNIGFDYGYGFNRDDGPRWQGHFLLGNINF